MSPFPSTYSDLISFFINKNCVLQLSEDSYENDILKMSYKSKIDYKYNVLMKCGHNRIVSFRLFSVIKHDNLNCIDCNVFFIGDKYNNLKKNYEDRGFVFDISKDEFHKILNNNKNIKNDLIKFSVLGSCGHRREINSNDVRRCLSNKCLDCARKDSNEKLRSQQSITDIPTSSQSEYDSVTFLTNIISDSWDVVLMNQGTRADCVIRPKTNISDNRWMMLQLKSTRKKNSIKGYQFTLHKNDYSNIVLTCMCVKDDKLWFIDPEIVKSKHTVTILEKLNTKFAKYSCDIDKVNDKLLEFYNDNYYTKVDIETANSTAPEKFIKEQEYIKLRESKISFLDFEYSEIIGLRYDFIVNGKKVQEKSQNFRTPCKNMKAYSFSITKSGKKNDKKAKVPYCKGDNDLYWLNLPDKKTFYLIPEELMIDLGYIRVNGKFGAHTILLYPYEKIELLYDRDINTAELNEYLFCYDNPDEKRIKELFDITGCRRT